jgi:hypothetical protein
MGYGVKLCVVIGIPLSFRAQDLGRQIMSSAPPPGRACVRSNHSGYPGPEFWPAHPSTINVGCEVAPMLRRYGEHCGEVI